MKDFGQGIFDMKFISSLQGKNFVECECLAMEKIAQSSATEMNKNKAGLMIKRSPSVNSMMISMSNFSLAHQGMSRI